VGNFDASGWPVLGVEAAGNSQNHTGTMMTWRCNFGSVAHCVFEILFGVTNHLGPTGYMNIMKGKASLDGHL
jgi:purine-cytosine permease-like protein